MTEALLQDSYVVHITGTLPDGTQKTGSARFPARADDTEEAVLARWREEYFPQRVIRRFPEGTTFSEPEIEFIPGTTGGATE